MLPNVATAIVTCTRECGDKNALTHVIEGMHLWSCDVKDASIYTSFHTPTLPTTYTSTTSNKPRHQPLQGPTRCLVTPTCLLQLVTVGCLPACHRDLHQVPIRVRCAYPQNVVLGCGSRVQLQSHDAHIQLHLKAHSLNLNLKNAKIQLHREAHSRGIDSNWQQVQVATQHTSNTVTRNTVTRNPKTDMPGTGSGDCESW